MTIPLQNSRVFGPFTRVLSHLASPRATERAWRAVGFPPDVLDGPPVFLPYRLQAQVVEAAARDLGERHLGALVASHFSYTDLDLYGAYVLDAPSLEDAFRRGKKALPFILNRSKVGIGEVDGHLLLGFASAIEGVSGSHHVDEGIPFLLIDLVRRFAGTQWRPAWVEMPQRKPAGQDRLADMFGTSVRYGRPLPAIAIPVADLVAINPRPWTARTAVVLKDLRALVRGGPPQTMAALVREALRLQLRAADPSGEAVAAQLGLGLRTLQRRLRLEGTSFREVREQVFSERAVALLAETDSPVTEIATALGYEEVNSFRRAFSLWYGVSPNAFRDRGQARVPVGDM